MKPQTQDADLLKLMYCQVQDLDFGPLLSGLTILVKDTATYITVYGVDNDMAEGFRQAYLDMLSDDRYYWRKFGPKLYQSLGDAGLPEGFASRASNCNGDLQQLTECDLDYEWLRAPGWHFFQTYSGQRSNDILRDITLEKLKAAFCEGKNPYEREANDSSIRQDRDPYKPIAGVVKQLVKADRFGGRTYWYPVMLYLALLLRKTDFTTLE